MVKKHFILTYLALFALFVNECHGYVASARTIWRAPTSLKCSAVLPIAKASISIRRANDLEMPNIAHFIATNEYGYHIPNGQRKEIARLALNSLREAYGYRIGRWRYPSALFVAEADDQILGCVGLAYQHFNPIKKEFTPVNLPNVSLNAYMQRMQSRAIDATADENIVMVLTHLLVDRNSKQHGIAALLVNFCEELIKEWGFKYAHMMAHSDNKATDKMCVALGFKKYFRGRTTRAVSTPAGLKQDNCGFYCYRKAVDEEPEKQTLLQRLYDCICNLII